MPARIRMPVHTPHAKWRISSSWRTCARCSTRTDADGCAHAPPGITAPLVSRPALGSRAAGNARQECDDDAGGQHERADHPPRADLVSLIPANPEEHGL